MTREEYEKSLNYVVNGEQQSCEDKGMTREEAYKFLMDISYAFGNMSIEYLTEKDGEKMREAVCICMQEPYNDVLDKIRTEIEALLKVYPFIDHYNMYVKLDDVKKIIDKYIEREG